MIIEEKKKIISDWFFFLRDQIIDYIEGIEKTHGKGAKFQKKKWNRDGGGGGEISVIYGEVFEKMGVNVSVVSGDLSEPLRSNLPGVDTDPKFWASGISLVSHPTNPFVPPIHMNNRCMSTANKSWFGVAFDLNPIYIVDEDSRYFHSSVKELCDLYNPTYYEKFSKECDEYFFLKHRNESRGIGGIFADYLEESELNFGFIKKIGSSFVPIYDKIVQRNINRKWTDADRDYQLLRRGRYAEFNLIYDRGIKFGLETGGNPDGMFMSLPPLVKWI